jgi:hypothetical protein
MRRILLVATMASVALASCVKDESVDLTQQAKKLSFATPVMGTQSRANVPGEISGTTYPTNENFAAFAWQYTGENDDWWENKVSFWSDTEIWAYTADTGEPNWSITTGNKSYYWPKAPQKLAFSAYSPAELAGTVSYTSKDDGLTVTDFTVDGTVANQLDLMYAFKNGCTEALNGDDGVPLNFQHALSSIVFAAIDNDDNADYEINSITIKGKFQIKGTFKELATTKWSGSPESTAVTYAPSVCVTKVPEDQATEFTFGTSALLMIPQAVPADATVSIVYTVKPKTGAPSYTVNTDNQNGTENPIKLKNFLIGGAAGSIIENWAQGKRYTYLIQFGGSKKIFFVPTVTNWTPGDNAQITI